MIGLCSCVLLICTMCFQKIYCEITFSSKNSAIKLCDYSTLEVAERMGYTDDPWRGTLIYGHLCYGNKLSNICFRNGILKQDDTIAYRSGWFELGVDFVPKPFIHHRIYPEYMKIDGECHDSFIMPDSGQWPDSVIFGNGSGRLYIEVNGGQCDLALESQDASLIDLQGGILTLLKDLYIGEGEILGPGLICGNGCTLQFGREWIPRGQTIPIREYDSPLNFYDIPSIGIARNSILMAEWGFEGENFIDGSATVLDISDDNAKIVIYSRSTLVLKDVYLKGFDLGKVIFTDDTSALNFSGGRIDLGDDVLMTTGVIDVVGSTLISTGAKGWIFTDDAVLNVSNNVLWIDSKNLVDEDILFGAVDGEGVYTSLIDNSTVRQVTDQSQVLSPTEEFLLSGSVTGTVYLERSFLMHPTNQVRFVNDTLLTASGAGLYFSTVDDPQLVILPNVVAAFQDVKLVRTNNETFQIQPHGSVSFDPKVEVEFSEDINITTGVYRLTGSDNICYFKGIGGQKRLAFSSISDEPPPLFSLRAGILALEDISLFGLDYMNWESHLIDGDVVSGALALKGKSILNVDSDLNMNIIVEGRGNEIHLLENDLHFRGNISFGDQSDNSLTIRFALQEEVAQLRVYFENGALSLSSDVGRAGLIFDDFDVSVVNQGVNSFVAGANSYLGGNRITIEKNQIQQLSSNFELESGLDLKSSLNNPINISFLRSPFEIKYNSEFTTVFHRLREHKDLVNGLEFKKRHANDNYFSSAASRSIRIPNPNLRVKKRMKSGALFGSVRVEQEGELTDFFPNSEYPLSLELSGGARVYTRVRRTRFSRRPVRSYDDVDESFIETFKHDDKIYVSGTDNKIVVTGYLHVIGEIIMDEDSELIFEFDDSLDTEKTVVFGDTDNAEIPFNIVLPKSSSMVFQGSGDVKFGEDVTIECNGTLIDKISENIVDLYEDDRPSIIFKKFARLLVEDSEYVLFSGCGIFSLHDYAQIRITGGHLQIGNDVDDYFDFIIDRGSSLKLGYASSTCSNTFDSKMSFPTGKYNIMCDRLSSFEILNDGLFEISLLDGVYSYGRVNSFVLDGGSHFKIDCGGRFALGQEKVYSTSFVKTIFPFDNIDSTISGDGFIALYTETSSLVPSIEGKIQPRYFSNTSGDAYNVFKKLVIVSPGKLDTAVDFVDRDCGYNLITSQNKIVEMDSDDIIGYQDAENGYVYGTKIDGREFRIQPNGVKQHRKI